MLSIKLDPNDPRSLVDQIVAGISRQIDERCLRPGTKLPSIRKLADVLRNQPLHGGRVLRSAGGSGLSRGAARARGSSRPPLREAAIHHMPSDGQKHNEELVWLVRRLLEAREGTVLAGGPWLPHEWMDETGIRQSLSALARKSGAHLIEYGNPQGYLPLREHLVLMLSELGITARASQIVLTQGTSQALDLITRHFIKPGDGVLVDDPGYYNLFGSLRLHGAKLLGVPRNPDGPDIDALERLAAEHRPRIYFTQSALQNPTGTDMSPHASFRVLQLAEQYDFLVVEDDIFCDFQIRKTPRLAALDQFNRVIYARSFSKTFSGSLRVGFLVAQQAIADRFGGRQDALQHHELAIRRASALFDAGRRPLSEIPHPPPQEAGRSAGWTRSKSFERLGLQLFVEPEAGMFLWARFPHVEDALMLTKSAESHGIMLAPGVVFRPHLQRSPWMRFNVTTCDDPAVLRWLAQVAARPKDAWALQAAE